MPGVEIETVTLDEEIGHPLDAVLEKVDRSKTGPLMIVGLERSNPSSAKERPILYALNMSRPEWPKKLPRPIVFWVPEYLLGLMGREAPDFLDWRSDTLFFPENGVEELLVLGSRMWLAEDSPKMSGVRRQARIEELRSRLAVQSSSNDPVVVTARFSWLDELSFHLMVLGELDAAERVVREALSLAETYDVSMVAPARSKLADLYRIRGKYRQAEEILRDLAALYEGLGEKSLTVSSRLDLASVLIADGRHEEGERVCRDALREVEELGDHTLQSLAQQMLARVAGLQGDWDTAEDLLQKSLSESMKRGLGAEAATALYFLGIVNLEKGDLATAENKIKKALEVATDLGYRKMIADIHVGLGLLHQLRGDPLRAYDEWSAAHSVYQAIGIEDEAADLSSMMASLDLSSEA